MVVKAQAKVDYKSNTISRIFIFSWIFQILLLLLVVVIKTKTHILPTKLQLLY